MIYYWSYFVNSKRVCPLPTKVAAGGGIYPCLRESKAERCSLCLLVWTAVSVVQREGGRARYAQVQNTCTSKQTAPNMNLTQSPIQCSCSARSAGPPIVPPSCSQCSCSACSALSGARLGGTKQNGCKPPFSCSRPYSVVTVVGTRLQSCIT